MSNEISGGYLPLDLSTVVNGVDEARPDGPRQWRGRVALRGIPFEFAERDGATGVVTVEEGSSVRVTVPQHVSRFTSMIVAHRIEDPRGPGLAPVGRDAGTYEIEYADGHVEVVPIRDGFEVSAASSGARPDWGVRPALAVPDQNDEVPDPCHGPFTGIGERQTEVVEAARWSDRWGDGELRRGGWSLYLWPWLNPRPTHEVLRLRVNGGEVPLTIGAITLGVSPEHPLRPEAARPVIATVPEERQARIDELTIEVDRGTAGYTRPLHRPPDESDPLAGWGDSRTMPAAHVSANVSATPSATVRLMDGDQCLAEGTWAELTNHPHQGGSLQITERGKNWVRTRVVDAETRAELPCRVHFSSPDGVPYQPHGHHSHVHGGLSIPTFTTTGADVRLGNTTYAYIDGACEGWLPHGRVHVQVSRGFDYQAVNDVVSINPDQDELTIEARRVHDPAAEGWYSGDTHVHFVSTYGGLREAAAEGVSIVHLLLSQWGHMFTNTADFLGRPVASDDGATILYASQENRQHFLGHLGLLGLNEPVMPWCTDGPAEAEMGSALETTLSEWADRCRERGGVPIISHFPAPNGELATLIATGRVGAVETLEYQERAHVEYYRYLNAGFRVPLAGATDKMSSEVPIGLHRTYVQLDQDQEFGFDAWCQALTRGRSYQTSGPLLSFAVEGHRIGDTVRLAAGGGTVQANARADCIFPMYRLELIHNGRCIASADSETGARTLRLSHQVRVDDAGWLAIRVVGGGPDDLTNHRDEWQRAIMAHSSPIYVACGENETMADLEALQYTARLVDRGRAYVADLAPKGFGNWVSHHHGDHNHVLKPFFEAQEALEARIADARRRSG